MSFKDTQSYKELQSDWRWIHEMDPEAAAAADQWVKEHPEEWKELEHRSFGRKNCLHKRVAIQLLSVLSSKLWEKLFDSGIYFDKGTACRFKIMAILIQ